MRIPTEDFTGVALASEDTYDHVDREDFDDHDDLDDHDDHEDSYDYEDRDDHDDHEKLSSQKILFSHERLSIQPKKLSNHKN